MYIFFQVAEKLHQRADKNAPDKYDFRNLASRVEEFTLRLLDALNYDTESRKMFFNNPETDVLLETAIKLEQKKVMLKGRQFLYKVIRSPVSYLLMAIFN